MLFHKQVYLEALYFKIYPSSMFKAWDFPGGTVVKTSTSNAGDEGLIPGWGVKIPPTCLAVKKPEHKQKKQ